MATAVRKLVTIVTEARIERQLLAAVEAAGARGWTITDVRGKGSRGVRRAEFDLSGNLRLEVVCETAVAEAIAASVRERFYADYAMILYLQDVEVLRPEKF
ncbi:MAG: hypothetical protein U0S76_03755 [Pseudoxanthomonas sp.]|nr:hypothetical protein [Pseudoxanthomonas sp.]